MRSWELMQLAVEGVLRTRLRSMLTILGISIASGSLVCMISFVLGLQRQLEAPALQLGLFNNIEVYPRSQDSTDETPARILDEEAVRELESIKGVDFAYPDLRLSQVEVSLGDKSASTYAVGLPREASLTGLFGNLIAAGDFFSLALEPQAIIGEQLAKELGFERPEDAINQPIQLKADGLEQAAEDQFTLERREQTVSIVGVYRPPSFATNLGGKVILLPLDVIRTLPGSLLERGLNRLRSPDGKSLQGYAQVTVRVVDPMKVSQVEPVIQEMGFETRSMMEKMQEARTFFLFMKILLTAVGTVALIVAGLGILNTLLMSVLQRIREIGIYKAVGASDGDIRMMFLTEAALLGFLGGVGGLLLARVVAVLITWGVMQYAARQGFEGPLAVFVFPAWLIVASIGYAITVSIVSGIYPASRAAKIDPIDALRYE